MPATPTTVLSDRVVAILESACRVVIRDGAHRLRMASVAAEAGVSKALVHYYFPTRQDLLRAAFQFSESRSEALVAAEVEELTTGRERVARSLSACIDAMPPYGEYRALWTAMWQGLHGDDELGPVVRAHYRTWVDLIAERIREGQDDGSIALRVDPPASALRLAAVTDGLDSMLYIGLTTPAEASVALEAAVALELDA